jgi:hypothetical protein
VDQKFTSAGTLLSGLLMLFCAFIVLPVGLGFLFSYPDPVWWVGPLLLLSCAAFVHNGIVNIRLSKKLAKDAEEDQKLVSQQLHHTNRNVQSNKNVVALNPTNIPEPIIDSTSTLSAPQISMATDNDTIVLAHWKYQPEEWKKFCKWEMRERKLNSTIEACLIVIISALFISGIEENDWLVTLLISVFVALIYWLGKYFLSMASIGQPKGKDSEVVITQYAVIINGKHNAFQSQMYWRGNVSIKEEPSPKVLEIVYNWQTRSGISHDEIRVPIPEGKLEEAKWLAGVL